jgi:hypothetical protein
MQVKSFAWPEGMVSFALGIWPNTESPGRHSSVLSRAGRSSAEGEASTLLPVRISERSRRSSRPAVASPGASCACSRNPGLPLRFVYLSGPALESGIQERKIHGATIRVYSPAKTVADCFKFRNKVGMDVAMEALREGWRARRFQMDELTAAAKACRVWRIMRPYMELLVA